MGRRAQSNYLAAAKEVLNELGGGPIASRDLVAAAQERGLIGDGKWVYHNMLRRIRESDEFDTSRRGYVALAGDTAPPVTEEPTVEVAKPTNPAPTFEADEEPTPETEAAFGEFSA